MFITEAFAQAEGAAPGASALGSGLEMLFLFAPLMVVWYFFLIRPQRAQMKKRQGNPGQYSPRRSGYPRWWHHRQGNEGGG